MASAYRAVFFGVLSSMILAACSPSSGVQQNRSTPGEPTTARQKVLTIGTLREPYSIEGFVSGTVRDLAEAAGDLAHNHLTVLDPNGQA